MLYTVWGAFNAFRSNSVDIDPEVSKKAKSSRDYLFDQLKGLNSSDSSCPKMNNCMPYGSFARKTKISPIDDIDLLAMMAGTGLSASQSQNNIYNYWLKIHDNNAPLAAFRDNYGYISSIKLLNQIKKSLSKVKNYSKAELKRNEQAVVLNLTSYSWVYDIVPAIPISNYFANSKIDYYLIPNGTGDWMRTDPRKDTEYVTRVNKQHDGELLPVIRLLKYWNWRTHKPRLPSYYFETLCLRIFDNGSKITSYPSAVRQFFSLSPYYLDIASPDPKGLGPNLDAGVSSDTKQKVKEAMTNASLNATNAISYQTLGQESNAINAWKMVFGPTFPNFG